MIGYRAAPKVQIFFTVSIAGIAGAFPFRYENLK